MAEEEFRGAKERPVKSSPPKLNCNEFPVQRDGEK